MRHSFWWPSLWPSLQCLGNHPPFEAELAFYSESIPDIPRHTRRFAVRVDHMAWPPSIGYTDWVRSYFCDEVGTLQNLWRQLLEAAMAVVSCVCGAGVGCGSVVFSDSSHVVLDQFCGIIWALCLAAEPQSLVLWRLYKQTQHLFC